MIGNCRRVSLKFYFFKICYELCYGWINKAIEIISTGRE